MRETIYSSYDTRLEEFGIWGGEDNQTTKRMTRKERNGKEWNELKRKISGNEHTTMSNKPFSSFLSFKIKQKVPPASLAQTVNVCIVHFKTTGDDLIFVFFMETKSRRRKINKKRQEAVQANFSPSSHRQIHLIKSISPVCSLSLSLYLLAGTRDGRIENRVASLQNSNKKNLWRHLTRRIPMKWQAWNRT